MEKYICKFGHSTIRPHFNYVSKVYECGHSCCCATIKNQLKKIVETYNLGDTFKVLGFDGLYTVVLVELDTKAKIVALSLSSFCVNRMVDAVFVENFRKITKKEINAVLGSKEWKLVQY